MQTLNIIGAGRVGQTLGRLWQACGVFAVQDVLTTNPASARAACDFIGAGTPKPNLLAMQRADVWMLAVPDAHIAPVVQMLSEAVALSASPTGATPTIAFHCSGAQSAESLAVLAALGWQTASAHCILSFASAEVAARQFAGTACALEGHPSAIALLRAAFEGIQAHCFEVAGQDKVLYHAAAVFATNFLPVLQSVAEDAWRATGVPQELLPHLRATLLSNAVANITRMGPAQALTGPAARGDVQAIARQAAVVSQWDAQAGAAYEALSALALRIAKARTEAEPTKASTH
jgi:predicted short-subunit dehydrogenase-like oxidoreductase (DUF2520 family)